MLFGDHAVVHERHCIVTSVDHRIGISLEKRSDNRIVLSAPDVNLLNYTTSIKSLEQDHPKDARFAIRAIFNFFDKYKIETGLEIKTKAEFSSKFGLGSSSAVIVSTIKGLAELFKIEITNKELFDLSYKTVLDIQEVGSGFDVAAAIYGGTLYFVTGGKMIKPIKIEGIPLLIGYTGIKADTATLVKMVYKKLSEQPEKINEIFNKIEKIVNLARTEMENSNWEKVGGLMNLNQDLLRNLGVSSKELENLIKAALDAGAYGAKLSGAGGGDCMIAIVSPDNTDNVKDAIQKAGGQIIETDIQAEGVRIEK